MIYRLLVPATIEDNDAVRVLEWHVSDGEPFGVDALLVEVETHKALIEIRSGQSATLRRRLAIEGEWCPLGEALALFSDDPDEAVTDLSRPMPAEFLIG